MKVAAVIPALDEEASVGGIVRGLPRDLVQRVLVVDNGSADRTAEVARAAGAEVVREPRRGYGQACLTGIRQADGAEVILFLDADGSDVPSDARRILAPILQGRADMVVGSRMRGRRERGALPAHARFGNRLASLLMLLLWRARYSDLGPFRAIRADALRRMRMADRNFGWTVEMQIKAARKGLRVLEVPVGYRRRVGRSKISGTLRGSLLAGAKILFTITRLLLWDTKA